MTKTNKRMDKSKVYFTNLRTTPSSNLLDKMERLVKRAPALQTLILRISL